MDWMTALPLGFVLGATFMWLLIRQPSHIARPPKPHGIYPKVLGKHRIAGMSAEQCRELERRYGLKPKAMGG